MNEDQFSYMIHKCHVYLRTSDVDSWCIAHSDASFAGLKVIASDACPRMKNTILFSKSSFSSLLLAFHSLESVRVPDLQELLSDDKIRDTLHCIELICNQ